MLGRIAIPNQRWRGYAAGLAIGIAIGVALVTSVWLSAPQPDDQNRGGTQQAPERHAVPKTWPVAG